MYTTLPICTWYLKCRIVVLWIVKHTNLVGAAVKYILKLVKSLNIYDGSPGQACQFLLVITCYIDWRVLIISTTTLTCHLSAGR